MQYTGCFFNRGKISGNTACSCGSPGIIIRFYRRFLIPAALPNSSGKPAGSLLPVMKSGKCGTQNTGESVVASARIDVRRKSLRSVFREPSCASGPCSLIPIVHLPPPLSPGSQLPAIFTRKTWQFLLKNRKRMLGAGSGVAPGLWIR
jgi:hypothetical protein